MRNVLIITMMTSLPLIAQDFLEGVRAEDLMLDRIEEVPIEIVNKIEDNWLDYWLGSTFSLVYSPDSSLIAEDHEKEPRGLYILDLKTNTKRRIVEEGVDDLKWSPSGRYLSFVKYEYIGPSGVEKRTRPPYFNHERLCVFDIKTGEIKSIYDLGRVSIEHWWSPIGDYLAYSGFYKSTFKFAVYDAENDTEYIIDTTFAWRGELWGFSWSPNGKMLVYTKPLKMDFTISEEYPVISEVFVVNYDGTGRTQITDTPESELYVKWLTEDKLIINLIKLPEGLYEEGEEYRYLILKKKEHR